MKPDFIYSSLLSLVIVSGVAATGGPHQLDFPKFISPSETLRALPKTIQRSSLLGRDSNQKDATDISKSWNGATLFSFEHEVADGNNTSISAGIEVTCTICYIKGRVTTELGFADDFNITQAIANFTEVVTEEIKNITKTAFEYVKDKLTDDVNSPPLNISFNIDEHGIPECRLHFQFDDLELYMQLDTVLSAGATYTLNLFSSNTLIGVSRDSKTLVGVVVSIDLILGVDADIDISSGLHIKVDDGMALDLLLFDQNVSSVTFNGASFEFLPVKVQSASGVLTAKLRVGMHAGVSVEVDLLQIVGASAGTEVLVYADLAEFTTNITAVPEGDDSDCQFRVQQAYQLALGAAAGATLAYRKHTWGPDPETKIPIFYTTLADECATSVSKITSTAVVVTPTSQVAARADENMTTTTLTEEATFTGLVCVSTGLSECPASLQSTTKVISTRTLITMVPSGSEATFPATIQTSIPSLIPFLKNSKVIAATTGSPTSYSPPPPPPSSTATTATTAGSGDQGNQGDQSNKSSPAGKTGVNKPLIIGLTVGLGTPFLAIVVGSIYYFLLKRRGHASIDGSGMLSIASPQPHTEDARSPEKKLTTTITTIGGPDRN